MSIIEFNQDIEQPIMQPGNVFGENTEPIRPELYDLLRHWVTERAHAENSLVAAGVPRRNINPSQDQVLRSHYNDEMIILNEKLERVQWPPDNPSTILVNSANVRHAHGGGVAKSIADMFPVEVLEHVQRLRMPLLPHSTTFHPVQQGTTPIVKVQGVIDPIISVSLNIVSKHCQFLSVFHFLPFSLVFIYSLLTSVSTNVGTLF